MVYIQIKIKLTWHGICDCMLSCKTYFAQILIVHYFADIMSIVYYNHLDFKMYYIFLSKLLWVHVLQLFFFMYPRRLQCFVSSCWSSIEGREWKSFGGIHLLVHRRKNTDKWPYEVCPWTRLNRQYILKVHYLLLLLIAYGLKSL